MITIFFSNIVFCFFLHCACIVFIVKKIKIIFKKKSEKSRKHKYIYSLNRPLWPAIIESGSALLLYIEGGIWEEADNRK